MKLVRIESHVFARDRTRSGSTPSRCRWSSAFGKLAGRAFQAEVMD
jgi:hypothetical protein